MSKRPLSRHLDVIMPAPPNRRWAELCPCGHPWVRHDVGEAGDDDLCCVEGCEQNGCPGRAPLATKEDTTDAHR